MASVEFSRDRPLEAVVEAAQRPGGTAGRAPTSSRPDNRPGQTGTSDDGSSSWTTSPARPRPRRRQVPAKPRWLLAILRRRQSAREPRRTRATWNGPAATTSPRRAFGGGTPSCPAGLSCSNGSPIAGDRGAGLGRSPPRRQVGSSRASRLPWRRTRGHDEGVSDGRGGSGPRRAVGEPADAAAGGVTVDGSVAQIAREAEPGPISMTVCSSVTPATAGATARGGVPCGRLVRLGREEARCSPTSDPSASSAQQPAAGVRGQLFTALPNLDHYAVLVAQD